jgi:hypothetical protein
MRYIRLKAYEDFHFSNGESMSFTCSHPDCLTIFTKRGQWTYHSSSTGHDRLMNDTKGDDRRMIDSAFRSSNTVPDQVELPLLQMEREYQRAIKDLEARLSKLKEVCGTPGSVKRQEFEEAFLNQLENDPLYREYYPVRQSGSIRLYEMWIDQDKKLKIRST